MRAAREFLLGGLFAAATPGQAAPAPLVVDLTTTAGAAGSLPAKISPS